MAIWNLGSINADFTYRVPHLPTAGETLASTAMSRGLGGKGANMSVAAARAAAHVYHIGAIGSDGVWAKDRLLEYGVDTRFIAQVEHSTAHAIIAVDEGGENQIILHPGANHHVPKDLILSALSQANAGDIFVTQNETSGQIEAMRTARSMGLRTVYAAAPFDVSAVAAVKDLTDILILNEVEAEQLSSAMGMPATDLGIAQVVMTKGSKGATVYENGNHFDIAAIPVEAVDTTGAGDTFAGFYIAGLDRGMPAQQALDLASLAAAIMVTRVGTADVIPDLKDIEDSRLR
ncbi:ribokinase [Nereida sp. MMG025]|uniref:ribokinase n=1 Tax=Nereida sp. MMG025 TaxID=2909981 RepID=UPI001F35068A|nr:ribokinase [Nereida sp. MMG025]MCF6444611.1 ribokinase [Nereida sp. MMG025]